jgi:3-methyladenine DNA glycosylase AlkD
MQAIENIRKDLRKAADPKKAVILQRFFKTGPGQYGEGDVFLGVMVPESRKIAKKYRSDASLQDINALLESKIHEERLVALLILLQKYSSGTEEEKHEIAKFYIKNLDMVNNWDLVDLTAPNILGGHLAYGGRSLLYKLAGSSNVWERRVAIVATLHFIRNDDFSDTLEIAEMLLGDSHDLIHKAAGWMLREVGKKDPAAVQAFLDSHCTAMPRTMLRYAIERLPEKKRRFYMMRKT